MMTVALTIAFVVLFGVRLAMEWLAHKYEFFEQWLTITTIALIVVTVVLAISLVTYLAEQFMKLRNTFPKKGEAQQAQAQAAQNRKSRERGNARAERKENRARRAAYKQAERDKIYRIEAFEKRLKK